MNEDINAILELRETGGGEAPTPPTGLSGSARLFLYSFVVFLVLSALISIVAILAGNFGKLEIKIVLTTTTISLSSICCLCCASYARKTAGRATGMVGIGLAALSAILIVFGIWMEIEAEEYWNTTAVLSVFAVAGAHVLGLCLASLRDTHRWVLYVAGCAIFLLAAIVSALIVGEGWDDEGMFKLIAVLSIVAALCTVSIPILHRIDRGVPAEQAETLVLTKNQDGTYRDRDGKVFTVTESDVATPGELCMR